MNVPRKYGFLRFLSFLLKLLAWLILLVGVAAVVVAIVLQPQLEGILPQFASLASIAVAPLVCVIGFIQLFAFGSILSLLVDIEENTRVLAIRLPTS